ncbi:hypothetical protein BWI96_01645 [Siphonobacter sp. SORGH_AS_0500]|uniref:hypothetical protein n=1 Tax=Siphonobacter sp. SORGH_AS_0500 TaxID=1864824 RepID=UPI000CAD18E8|nr:hypothetical protein [Siphonobacter sp. SORGH_AS_0500]PKK38501.1 hypothetical protein BWI96_01645 [Siphonobacter sp. SORGH_AS_0500]
MMIDVNKRIKINLLKTPILGVSFVSGLFPDKYSLSDFAYGELLIFENNYPQYYVYLLDDYYKDLISYAAAQSISIDVLLNQMFKFHNLTLTTRQSIYGFERFSKSSSEEWHLPYLPMDYWLEYRATLH